MGDTPSIYSDYQYERLRLRLLAFQRKHSKKPQGLANDIVSRTGYAMTYDGGRKRVERFLRARKSAPTSLDTTMGKFDAN